MSTTRRGALGAALVAPLLARFTGTASADEATADQVPNALGTISDGWVEVRWTREFQEQLDRTGAVVSAVAPARLVTDADASAVRFPVESGSGDPSLADLPKAHGEGALAGGITIRTTHGTFELTGLRSDLRSGLASGKCAVNGVYTEHGSVLQCGLDEARLTTQSVPPGSPMKVRIAEVPLRATPDLIAAYGSVLGDAPFTTDTTLGYLTAEGMYHPPAAWTGTSQ